MTALLMICLTAVAIAAVTALGRLDGRGRQLKAMREQAALSSARLGAHEELVHKLREVAWESRDVDPILSQLVINLIREFQYDPEGMRRL